MDNAKGAQVRSRVKWVEEGEKSSSYFLNLEKKRQSYNVIDKISYDGKEANDDAGILNICRDFLFILFNLLLDLVIDIFPESVISWLNDISTIYSEQDF